LGHPAQGHLLRNVRLRRAAQKDEALFWRPEAADAIK
jgi:hypothetical protein